MRLNSWAKAPRHGFMFYSVALAQGGCAEERAGDEVAGAAGTLRDSDFMMQAMQIVLSTMFFLYVPSSQ